MRTAILAVMLLAGLAGNAGRVLACPVPDTERTPSTAPVDAWIVVDPFFQQVVKDLLASSATLRDQYERIVSAGRVRVWVQPLFGRPGQSVARATIGRSPSGVLLARVEMATPLRSFEYAEMLAHEFEHVLEQIEGVRLSDLADRPAGGVSRLIDGSYETDRARRAGRAAAREVEQNADVR